MWIVSYTDAEIGWRVTALLPTHEAALHKQAWAKARGHFNVQIKFKGAK